MSARDFSPRLSERDARWCLACNRWGHRTLVRGYFSRVSRLGDGAAWYVLMAMVVLLDGMVGLRVSTHLAATGLFALLLYRVLKRWTRRPRPFASDRRIHALVRPLDEFSFPSGHTLHAVAFSVVAIAHYPMLAWLLLPFTASVAVSRVVLGLHYPSDVLAALGIGLIIGNGSVWLASTLALLPA